MADVGDTLPSASERLALWRAAIVGALAKACLFIPFPALVWLLRDAIRLETRGTLFLVIGYYVSALGCAFAPASLRFRPWWLVLNFAVAGMYAIFLSGPVAGVGAVITFVAVLAVFVLGARAAGFVLGSMLVVMMSWAGLLMAGVLERPPAVLSDTGIPSNAIRMIFMSGTFATIILLASAYLIRKLTSTLFESERLVISQRAEMAAREEETKRRRLIEQELIRAQKIEAVGRLAGGVAHDVNNNLTVALACADLIERAARADLQTKQLCAAIRDACTNASTLTRQLLTLGRRDVSQPEVVSLAQLMPRLERLLQTSLGKRVRIKVDVPAALPGVYVDPRQLEQVLLNLAINARDAMPDGGQLSILAEDSAAPARYGFTTGSDEPPHAVRLHVRDEGTGIDAALLPQLVEPFFTTKDPERGTGLGLAVARAFAEASGGRLCIDSELGKGACFTLELPAASPQQASEAELEAASRVEPPSHAITVLVVDDDQRVRKNIVSELETAGYRVLEAEDGMAALERAQGNGSIDLLCTDAVMPRLGGEDLITRFRELHPKTRILVCSAYVQDEGLRELLRAGRYAALVKPFSPAELRESVARALAAPAPGNGAQPLLPATR